MITKRWYRWLAGGALMLGLLVVILPSIVVRTPLRRWIVDVLLAREGVEATIDRVHVGWFTPTRLAGITLGPIGKQRLVEVDQVRSDRTLWTTIWQGVDIEHLDVIRPQIHIWADADGSNLDFSAQVPDDEVDPQDFDRDSATRTLQLTIQDAGLWLKASSMTDETLVFRGLNLKGSLVKGPQGRELIIEPGRLLDHAEISPELCDGGLKYIVPILSEATWTKGELSLDIDSCVFDLDDPHQSVVTGKLYIHGIEAGIKNDLIAAVRDQLAMVLGTEGFESVHLADNSVVQFQVRDGQVWHDGLAIGLPKVAPELVIRSQGSVSVKEDLDLTVSVPIPLHLIADGPIAQAMSGKSLTLYAGGTLSAPKWQLANEDFLTDMLSTVTEQLADDATPILSLIQGLKSLRGGDDKERRMSLRERLRSWNGDDDEKEEEQQRGLLRRLFGGDTDKSKAP